MQSLFFDYLGVLAIAALFAFLAFILGLATIYISRPK